MPTCATPWTRRSPRIFESNVGWVRRLCAVTHQMSRSVFLLCCLWCVCLCGFVGCAALIHPTLGITMAVKLDDYRELLESINPTLRDSLAANFTEAARIMSPAGLHNYLEGARALSQLGRGNDLVASYIEEMPAVVKEAGEDVIKDCVNAALK